MLSKEELYSLKKDLKVSELIQKKFWENVDWLKMSEIKPKGFQNIIGYGLYRSDNPDYKFINDLNRYDIGHGLWNENKQILEVNPLVSVWCENVTHWMPIPLIPDEEIEDV